MRVWPFLFVAAVLQGGVLHAAEVRIGADGACSVFGSNIQAAINASPTRPTTTDILIARNATYSAQQLDINGKNIRLIGGYATCGQASVDTVRTVISGVGGDNNSVITVRGSTAVVSLRSLDIVGGDETTTSYGGGIDIRGGPHALVYLENMRIRDNSAGYGGGISIVNGSPSNQAAVNVLLFQNNLITQNDGILAGGGIYCENSTLSLTGANTGLYENRAGTGFNDAQGGGMRLVNCAAKIATSRATTFGTVVNNSASGAGGGISITGERAQLDLYNLDPNAPLTIANNTAQGLGGGIDIGSSAKVRSFDIIVDHNTSYSGGGGVSVFDNDGDSSDQALFLMQGTLNGAPPSAVNCAAALDCNRISYNTARTTGGTDRSGAGVRIQGVRDDDVHTARASLELFGTRLDHNTGHNLIDNVELLGQVHMDGNLIDANTVSADLIYDAINPFLRVYGVTIVNNTIGAAVLRTATYTELQRALVWQPGRPLFSLTNGPLLPDKVKYVLSPDLTNVPAHPTNRLINLGQAGFVDFAGGNYRLAAGALGIDFAPSTPGLTRDRFNRAVDIVQDSDDYGWQDIGAYEKQSADGYNSAPAIAVAGPLTLLEDAGFIYLQGFSLSDPDGDVDGGLIVTVPQGAGELQAFYFAGVEATQLAPNQVVIAGPFSRITADTANFAGATPYYPARDLFGVVPIRLEATDYGNSGIGGALWTEATLNVDILPVNDSPTLQIADIVLSASAQGPRTVDLVPLSTYAMGPANELNQTATFVLFDVFDPAGVLVAAPTLTPAGELSFTTSGALGTVELDAYLVDNGGTENGGNDRSALARFRIRVESDRMFADGFEARD